MDKEPICPKCDFENTYTDGSLWICPSCGHEWNTYVAAKAAEASPEIQKVCDAYGNILHDGDSVTVIKDLKIKGSSSVVKVGTKVKNIRIQSGADGHDIACKIDSIGAVNLKSEFVKKS